MSVSKDKINNLLSRNVEEVIKREHLKKALLSRKKLRVKLGIDPTAPDLHLGHAVVLRKLREFQDLGHKVVLIIGDFTGRIGDPSGRTEARKPLRDKEIEKNKRDYLLQAGKIIDVKKAEIRHNSEWFLKEGVEKLVQLAGASSMQQVLRRADFKKRLKSNRDVTLLELLYPLLQGYDSVKVAADVEIGGSDQLFNLLMGRRVQRYFGMKEQDILTVTLLEGIDGAKKMSKSIGNYIALAEPANEMFGKLMSLPDKLIVRYFEMGTNLDRDEIEGYKKKLKAGINPRDIKIILAKEIVALYFNKSTVKEISEKWKKRFSQKAISSADMPKLKLKSRKISALDLALFSKVAPSKSQARRLIEQGAVEIDGQRLKNPQEILKPHSGAIIKIGKKNFFRIEI